jgi:quercetin dioxygenase-like cupin family protein
LTIPGIWKSKCRELSPTFRRRDRGKGDEHNVSCTSKKRRIEVPEAKIYSWGDLPIQWYFDGGVGIRVISGDFTTILLADDKKGTVEAEHSHYQEQTNYLIRGKVLLRTGERTYTLQEGDVAVIPPYVEHGFEILEDSRLLVIMSPHRKELLPKEG